MVKDDIGWQTKVAEEFIQPAHSLHWEMGVLECSSYSAVYTFTVRTQGGTVLETSHAVINCVSGQS